MGTAKIEFKWAIILAIITFIVFFLSKILGWQTPETIGTHETVAFGGFLITYIVAIWLGLKEKRENDLAGLMTYGQAFWTGAIISLLGAVFMTTFIYCFICWINPDLVKVIGETENGFLKNFSMMSFVIGMVFTLILGFFAKKEA